MKTRNISNPKILKVLPEEQIGSLTEELVVRTKEVKNENFRDEVLRTIVFGGSVFTGCTFENIKVSQFECMDVLFDNCQFINCEFIGCFIKRVIFRKCRIVGLNLSESSIESLQIKNGILDMGAFYFSKIRGLSFEQQVIRNTDFYELDIRKWYFDACELQKIEVNKTSLAGVDFRNSTLVEMRVTLESLRDVIVTPTQALVLSSLLGLNVKEEWED